MEHAHSQQSSSLLHSTPLLNLIIIHDIHLLHDSPAPVLEAIVAPTFRWVEERGRRVRMLGLSATLPNYADVAKFIRVTSNNDIFFLHPSYPPCPLAQPIHWDSGEQAIQTISNVE